MKRNRQNKNSRSILSNLEMNAIYGEDEILYSHKQKEALIGKFAKLRYGNDLELIFNTDCQVKI